MDSIWWILIIAIIAVIWLGFSLIKGFIKFGKWGVGKVKHKRNERKDRK